MFANQSSMSIVNGLSNNINRDNNCNAGVLMMTNTTNTANEYGPLSRIDAPRGSHQVDNFDSFDLQKKSLIQDT